MQYTSHDQVTDLYKLAAEPKPKSQGKYEDYKSQQAREKAEWEGQPLHVRSPVLRAMKGAAKGAFKEVSDPTTKKFASKHGPENNEGVGVEGFVFNDDDVHAAARNKPLKKLASAKPKKPWKGVATRWRININPETGERSAQRLNSYITEIGKKVTETGKKASSPEYRAHFKKTMKSKGVDPENLGDANKGKVRKAFKSVDDSWKAEKEAHVIEIYKVAFAQEKEAGGELKSVMKIVAPKVDEAMERAGKRVIKATGGQGSILGAIADKLIPRNPFAKK